MPTNWNENKPEGSDLLSEFPSVATQNAIAFRLGIEQHSFWTDSSGASAGVPRLSVGSFGPGAARAFFDIASNVSSVLSTTKPLSGRLFVTSDTTRLYAFSDATAVPVGSPRALVFLGSSGATTPSNTRILVQQGKTAVSASTSTVAFATAYATAPALQMTAESTATTQLGLVLFLGSTTTNFTVRSQAVFGAAPANVYWRSIGSVTL